jgi:hypothetical protein
MVFPIHLQGCDQIQSRPYIAIMKKCYVQHLDLFSFCLSSHMGDCGQANVCTFIVANSILDTHGRLRASRLLHLHCCQLNSAHAWKIVRKQTFVPSLLPTQFFTHMEDCGQADFCTFIVANSILHKLATLNTTMHKLI